MASRFFYRMLLAPHLAQEAIRSAIAGRMPPLVPKRILIAHHLLLGDTLLLTPLLAKLRMLHPYAEIVMIVPTAIAPLYEKRPYGVIAWPFDPRRPDTVRPMLAQKGFDLAIAPADNRNSWLALALGGHWIVAHDGDRPAYKSWPVDRLISYPDTPTAWGEIAAQLVEGVAPPPYQSSDWPAPDCAAFDLPRDRYCVLHVGASTPLRWWQPEKWQDLAQYLSQRGFAVVWSGGRGENTIVTNVDPAGIYPSYAGRLDLPQLWHLVQNAALLVCPDTGVAHLGRMTGTPTAALFGPGSSLIFGSGEFWRQSPYRAVTIENFPCRDRQVIFKRKIAWIRHCARTPQQCPFPACMHAIGLDAVIAAVEELLPRSGFMRTITDPPDAPRG